NLFFPQRAASLDLSQPEWLDKELFTDPPVGDVYILDLVARVKLRTPVGGLQDALAVTLILMEVESRDAVAELRPRMYHYYEALRREYGCRVLPIALYLRVSLDGIGLDTSSRCTTSWSSCDSISSTWACRHWTRRSTLLGQTGWASPWPH